MIARLLATWGLFSVRLEPYQFAREARSLSLDLPIDAFPRLRDLVVDAEGRVAIRAEFRRDEQGRCRVTGHLSVPVRFRCGNCTEVESCVIDTDVDLCVVRTGEEARALVRESDLDPMVVDGPATTAAELFEDDLILALPERPCGGRVDCPHRPPEVKEEAPAPRRENPFAALAGLKNADRDADGGAADEDETRG